MSSLISRFGRSAGIVWVLAGMAVIGGVWWAGRAKVVTKTGPVPPSRPIYTTDKASHRVLGSLTTDGALRPVPVLPTLDEALGLESRLAYDWRLEVVHKLGAELPAGQIQRLVDFINEPRLPTGLTQSQVRALKNDVLNVLGLQTGFRSELVALLSRLGEDKAQDPVLRDYALQQLAGLSPAAADQAVHWRTAAGDDSALAPTALLHLLSLDREGRLSPGDHKKLATLALKQAGESVWPETSRATALQVCGQLKMVEARSLAYAVARSDKAGFPFRIAAVATLGDLGGDSETQAYLQQLATGREQRLRVPALSALKRFSLN